MLKPEISMPKLYKAERTASLPKFLPKLPHIKISTKLRYNLSKEYHKNLTQELLEKLKEQQRIRNIKEKERNSIYEIDAQNKKHSKNSSESRSFTQLNRRNRSVLNLEPKRDELTRINIPLYEYSLIGKSCSSLTTSASELKRDFKNKVPIFHLKEISDDSNQFPIIQTRSITNCKSRIPRANIIKSEVTSEIHDFTIAPDTTQSNLRQDLIKRVEIDRPNRVSRLRKMKLSTTTTSPAPRSDIPSQLASVLSDPCTPQKSLGTSPTRPNLRIITQKVLENSDSESSPLAPFGKNEDIEYTINDFTYFN